jgi:hypothetical protein
VSRFKFTKGPWQCEDVKSYGTLVYKRIVSKDQKISSINIYKQKNKAMAKANAFLIAAAPDMYRALKRIQSIQRSEGKECGYDGTLSDEYQIAEEALKKADGKGE